MSKEYVYSEIFNSVQGEGHYTGVPSAWLRFFLCNLQCDGFGQKDPTNPDTYELPYKDFDVSSITRVEDLPVWDKGCDSSYTWSKKYKHLMHKADAKTIALRIKDALKTETNPEGTFRHPHSDQTSHMCFTGGEPLMKHAQQAAIEIIQEFKQMSGGWNKRMGHSMGSNLPASITWETNGTQELTDEFRSAFGNKGFFSNEIFFSVSPKLWTVAGEKRDKAICPDIVADYYQLADVMKGKGQLKFVAGPSKEQWEEVDEVVDLFRQAGVYWPVWIMPTGATVEEQDADAGAVAKLAYERGYNVAARVHTYLFGNAIGT